MSDWIERSDEKFAAQACAFSETINADPFVYGSTPLAAAELEELRLAFVEAYAPTLRRDENTSSATLLKNIQRKLLADRMRAMAKVIRAIPSLSAEQIFSLGMPVPAGRRKFIPSPIDTPTIRPGAPKGRIVPICVKSTETPDKRGLPRDVHGIRIFMFVGDGKRPIDMNSWQQIATVTTAHFDLDLNRPDIASGTTVWLVAQYVNAKQQGGGPSDAVCTYALGPAFPKQNYVRVPGNAA